MTCRCPEGPWLIAPAPDRRSVDLRELATTDPDCGKACYWPDSGEITVQADWWISLDKTHQDAVLAHELAHSEGGGCPDVCPHKGGKACEQCADKRAGAILNGWGYSRALAQRLGDELIRTRPAAGQDFLAGWDAMANRHTRAPRPCDCGG